MTTLLERLRLEHARFGQLLSALERQIDVFAAGGDPDYDVIEGVADLLLDYPDRSHHPKEDALFARLREVDPAAAGAVGDVLLEHRVLRHLTEAFRETVRELLGETDIARDDVVEAARRYIAAERRHLGLENERLFPAAEQRFSPADWTIVARALEAGGRSAAEDDEAFDAFSLRLLAWEAETQTGA